MKNALWMVGCVALILGGYIYETKGRAELLPACARPYAGRVYSCSSRVFGTVSTAFGRLWIKVAGAPKTPKVQKKPAAPRQKEYVMVITYRDKDDLLSQLRVVPTGQKIKLVSEEEPVKIIHTGISCCDRAAIRAYRKKQAAEMEAWSRAVRAELDRIESP